MDSTRQSSLSSKTKIQFPFPGSPGSLGPKTIWESNSRPFPHTKSTECLPIFNHKYSLLYPSSEDKEKERNLEGIINNEPIRNRYEIIHYNQLNTFPYCQVGKVITKFEIDNEVKYLHGVGVLIGPRVVLTVAHNLVHYYNKTGRVYENKKVFFAPVSSWDFNLCRDIKCVRTYVNDDYIKALTTGNINQQWLNDWGLMIFDWDVGDFIWHKLNARNNDKGNNLQEWKGLYSFFLKNNHGNNKGFNTDNKGINTNSMDNPYWDCHKTKENKRKSTRSTKHSASETSIFTKSTNNSGNSATNISIVGYTEYTEANEAYKNSHIYFNNLNYDDDIDECEDYTWERHQESSSLDGEWNSSKITYNQGKILNELIDEGHANSKYSFPEDNQDGNEGWINGYVTSENTPNKGGGNQVDYIIFKEDYPYSSDYDRNLVSEKLIMTESIGKLNNKVYNANFIKYKISTYKGQSGSPIFIRTKMNNSYYSYTFIGLHSRRGPAIDIDELLNNKHCYSFSIPSKWESPTLYKHRNSGTDIKKIEMIKSILKHKSKLQRDGICDYNIAVGIRNNSNNTLQTIITRARSLIYPIKMQSHAIECHYHNISLLLPYTNTWVNGLYLTSTRLHSLFKVASEEMNIPFNYVWLTDKNSSVLNSKYDKDKAMNTVIDTAEISSYFEVSVNYKSFSKDIAAKVEQSFQQESGSNIMTNNQNNIGVVFNLIFREWECIEPQSPVYGKLFKKVRKEIMQKMK